jgi:NAD(P)-dependent dehydrogenase (short-subunit alcohol dehydrogenase family)
MGKLEGKIAVVTGGNSGIGLATARRFAEEGAMVVITGRREEALREAALEIGQGADPFRADMTQLEDIEALRRYVEKSYGRLDILFANAGVAAVGAFGEVSEETFDRTVTTNFKGTFFTVQTLLPLLKNGGSVILCSSISASKGFPGVSVYAATKAAIRSLARSLTVDLQDRRIRVNALSPGVVETPITQLAGMSKEEDVAHYEQTASQTPLGRNGEPAEIAAAALFLASDDSSFVAGAELLVDGGILA